MSRAAPSPQVRATRSRVQWSTIRPSLATGTANRAVGPDDAHVAGDGELHPEAHAGALDRGDGRHRGGGEVFEHLGEAGGERDVLELGEVGAGAEVALGAGEHDGAGVVGQGADHGAVEVLEGLEVQGVAAVGAVDGDGGDPVGGLEVDGHPSTVPSGCRGCRARSAASGVRTHRAPGCHDRPTATRLGGRLGTQHPRHEENN